MKNRVIFLLFVVFMAGCCTSSRNLLPPDISGTWQAISRHIDGKNNPVATGVVIRSTFVPNSVSPWSLRRHKPASGTCETVIESRHSKESEKGSYEIRQNSDYAELIFQKGSQNDPGSRHAYQTAALYTISGETLTVWSLRDGSLPESTNSPNVIIDIFKRVAPMKSD